MSEESKEIAPEAVELSKTPSDPNNDAMLSKLVSLLTKMQITSKIEPVKPQENTKLTDIIHRLNFQQDTGPQFIIDCQPDLRKSIAYYIHAIKSMTPTLDIQSYPLVSPFTLCAYFQILQAAYLLNSDLTHRPIPSEFANEFVDRNELKMFNKTLNELTVPESLVYILKTQNPLFEPHRPGLKFVPTMAGFIFTHDYGRTLPAYIWLLIHNMFALVPKNATSVDLIRQFYQAEVAVINNRIYTVSNFLGGYYTHGANRHQHRNWLNQQYEKQINRFFGTLNIVRPTLQYIDLESFQAPRNCNVNPYKFLLSLQRNNITPLTEMLNAISAFIKAKDLGKETISDIIKNSFGSSIVTHSIETANLPTHHYMDPLAQHIHVQPNVQSDVQYSEHIRFMHAEAQYNNNPAFPPANTPHFQPLLYQMTNTTHRPHEAIEVAIAYNYRRFNAQADVTPDILIAQPLGQNFAHAQFSLVHGFMIESDGIDGTLIPLLNPANAAVVNNSTYLVGSIPYQQIMKNIPHGTPETAIRLLRRTAHPHGTQLNAIHIRDASKVIRPVFDNENVSPVLTNHVGYVRENGHANSLHCYTHSSWYAKHNTQLPAQSQFLWSSYRHVVSNSCTNHQVHFYYTLSGLYGTNQTFLKIRHPATNFPET